MSNIKPTTPSYTFGYWRPWKENSNAFDSYLDYAKDVSLAKYGADIVGKYINQASKDQVNAINQLGQAIGRGMNVLSNQMSDINDSLGFLNRNMDIQIEQQKMSNLLLQNIAELLRVPDSEKERQHCIELGVKFFINAKSNSDLYSDSLDEFLKAESLMRQDYFVLHRIGCIYLYCDKYINPEKALDYFIKAAKYASVESDPNAMRLINILSGDNSISEISRSGFDTILVDAGSLKLGVVKTIKEITGCDLGKARNIVDTAPRLIKTCEDNNEAQSIKRQLEEIGAKVSIKGVGNFASEKSILKIKFLAADSYEKAAFTAYVLGRFEDAVHYQTNALNFNSSNQNRFLLVKYQVRNGNVVEAIRNLDKCIDEEPIYALAAFKEIDLINEPEVLKLIQQKNDIIDSKLIKLSEKWKKVQSAQATRIVERLTETSKKSYESKIEDFNYYEKEKNTIISARTYNKQKIDDLITKIKVTRYLTLDDNRISAIIKDLELARNQPLEEMIAAFDFFKNETDSDILKIGSKYAGGIVFYLNSMGTHGLVCADRDFGYEIWGKDGKLDAKSKRLTFTDIGADGNGIANGQGITNTKNILKYASIDLKRPGLLLQWALSGITWVFPTLGTSIKNVSTAARLCNESNYNGYNDWYLPTADELTLIFNNLHKAHLGSFKSEKYWSSTEKNHPSLIDFSSEGTVWSNKRSTLANVRGVRAFSI